MIDGSFLFIYLFFFPKKVMFTLEENYILPDLLPLEVLQNGEIDIIFNKIKKILTKLCSSKQ